MMAIGGFFNKSYFSFQKEDTYIKDSYYAFGALNSPLEYVHYLVNCLAIFSYSLNSWSIILSFQVYYLLLIFLNNLLRYMFDSVSNCGDNLIYTIKGHSLHIPLAKKVVQFELL